MKKLGIETSLKIYCIGNNCFDFFKKKYPNNEIENVETSDDYLSNWIEYKAIQNKDVEGKKMWANITSYKLYCINKELKNNNDVIFTDGDIVFDKNPFRYLIDNIEDNDLLIQNDNQSFSSKAFCTGFFLMKSNKKTIKITNFDEIQKNISSFQNDQQYLRRYEKQLKVKYLPLDLFPNGKYWRDNKPKNTYIIHFNYDVSVMKIKRMKIFNRWYIGQNIVSQNKFVENLSSISVNSFHTDESEEHDLTKFIEKSGVKIRQGYITQNLKHKNKKIESIKHYFGDLNKIKNVLEIGFLAGHSCEMFMNLNENIHVTSFDLGAFQSVNVGKLYINNNYPNKLTLIKGDGKKTI